MFELFQYYPFLLKGIYWTLLISSLSIVGGSIVGMLVALLRVSPSRTLRFVGTIYVDFFRTTPLIVQLIWIYYALPVLTGINLTEIQAGGIGMILYSAAYMAEIFRAGILSIEKGQFEAAMALGMTRAKLLLRIVLPQAVIRMIPAIANVFISKVKDSSLVSVIGVPELLRQASVMGEFTALRMESLTIAAMLYFCMTFPLTRLSDWLHERFSGVQRKGATMNADTQALAGAGRAL